jgi:hypothetical protein
LYNRLQGHLSNNSILADKHFGVRTNLTTVKGNYELINDTLSTLSDKLLTGGILCDFIKAFN